MKSEVTLKLEQSTYDVIREFAEKNHTSVQEILKFWAENLAMSFSNSNPDDTRLSDRLKKLQTGINLSPDIDYKEVYRKHLAEKYS